MTLKKHLITFAGIAAVSLFAVACASQPATTTTQATKSKAHVAKAKKSFLFLISSGDAQLNKLSSGQYQLTMDLPAIKQVVAFTDRPYRDAKFISAKKLQSLWSVGKNSFAKDHPNAVLSSKKLWPTIVEVDSVHTIHDQIHLIVRPLSQTWGTLHNLHKVTLTIDGVNLLGHKPAK